MEEQKLVIILSCSVLILLTMILLGFMVYFTYKIHRMIWNKDKIFPLMLIMLCLSLLGVGSFWMFTIVQVMNPAWACSTTSRSLACSGNIIAILPSFFLGIGVFLNLNKWVYFTLRINAFITVGFGVQENKITSELVDDVKEEEVESLVESESISDVTGNLA